MVVVVTLAYAAVAALEIWLWAERPWQKVLLYLVLIAAGAVLAALLLRDSDLKVPEPVGFVTRLIKRLWEGGGGK